MTHDGNTNAARRVSLQRWWMGLGLWLVLLVLIAARVLVPTVNGHRAHLADVKDQLRFLAQADAFPERVRKTSGDIALLDSLLRVYRERPAFDETAMLGALYGLADSTGCNASRVQVRDPMGVARGREIPIMITGRGSYASIGRFIEGIESMSLSTRVTHLALEKKGKEELGFTVDFVVME